MIKHKHIDLFAILAIITAILLMVFLDFGESFGLKRASTNPEYVNRLFNDKQVHHINLEIADFEDFLKKADEKQYIESNVSINGEPFSAV